MQRHNKEKNRLFSLFYPFCLILALLPMQLFAQTENPSDENTASNTEKAASTEKAATASTKTRKNFSTKFVNDSEFLFYFRHSQSVEITGNESTFTAAIRPDIDYFIDVGNIASFRFSLDIHFIQPLSLKARFYENFSPPSLLYNELMLDIELIRIFHLGFGLFKPLYNVLPMHSYFLPVVFKVSPLSANSVNDESSREVGHSFVTGHRDLPLSYIALNSFDTGLLFGIHYKLLEFITALSNGEEGLDPNSAKTISLRLALKNALFHSGFGFQIGNIGSVPIKEMKHAYQFFFYYSDERAAKVHWKIGFETFLYLHGIRDLDLLDENGNFKASNFTGTGSPYGNISDLQEHFSYVDGYFSPFSVFNNGSYDDSKQINSYTLYGLSFLVYVELAFIDMLNLSMHFSGYDANILSENNEMYKMRYRGFFRFSVNPVDFFSIVFSFTYTHDQLFLHWSQFYDSERRQLHPIEDFDIFLGFIFRFPEKTVESQEI